MSLFENSVDLILREFFVVGFEDRPDYRYLKKLFHDLFERSGFVDDGIFDWDLPIKLQIDSQ